MDPRLRITDAPREGIPDGLADTPVVTVAWRAMREEHQRRRQERVEMDTILVEIAEMAYRISRTALGGFVEAADRPRGEEEILSAVDGIERALKKAGVTILSPEGQRFTSELMDMFDNVAQLPDPETREPNIAEVLSPAILCRGALVRMGKAIISVPLEANEPCLPEVQEKAIAEMPCDAVLSDEEPVDDSGEEG